MDHVELFQNLAARSPEAAASFVSEMWCRPVICLYAIDTSKLRAEQRDEVIETRVLHKRELKSMYQWLWQMVDTNSEEGYAQSLAKIECVLAMFAMSDMDAKNFVLDVTGWSRIELASMYESSTLDWQP